MLKELVSKEVKNLIRDRKVIISVIIMPFVTFAVLGMVYGFGFSHMTKVAKEVAMKPKVLICNEDQGNMSSLLIDYALNHSSKVVVTKRCSIDTIKEALQNGFNLVVIIPKGFSANITKYLPANLRVFTMVTGISMTSSVAIEAATAFVNGASSFIRNYIAHQKGVPPNFIESPLTYKELVMFKGTFVNPNVITALSISSFLFLFAPLIVISTALGISSTSMAVENEEKTLEILLTLPIPRSKIVLGKLIGSSIIVALATISYMGGFILYNYLVFYQIITSATISESTTSTSASTHTPLSFSAIMSPQLIILVMFSTFISLVAVASLGILLGSMAPEVRVSQTYVGQMAFLVIIPAFVMMFTDIHSLGTVGTVILIAISPFIAPMLVMKSFIEGYTWVSIASIIWAASFSGLMLIIASKLLSSERLFTIQHRFRVGRIRRGGGSTLLRIRRRGH